MILKNRLFTRAAPNKDAKSLYIFCEGVKRERQYFNYFKELDSRINIEVYALKPHEDNSPLGLYNIACNCLVKSDINPNPKYETIDGDEVWIVLDTDSDKFESRKPQIIELRNSCTAKSWSIVESNPCFEVWLYNHFFSELIAETGIDRCTPWKEKVNKTINGGFDCRKHPIYINNAIVNSEANYEETDSIPHIGTTQVFFFAKSIYALLKDKIESAIEETKRNSS